MNQQQDPCAGNTAPLSLAHPTVEAPPRRSHRPLLAQCRRSTVGGRRRSRRCRRSAAAAQSSAAAARAGREQHRIELHRGTDARDGPRGRALAGAAGAAARRDRGRGAAAVRVEGNKRVVDVKVGGQQRGVDVGDRRRLEARLLRDERVVEGVDGQALLLLTGLAQVRVPARLEAADERVLPAAPVVSP